MKNYDNDHIGKNGDSNNSIVKGPWILCSTDLWLVTDVLGQSTVTSHNSMVCNSTEEQRSHTTAEA